MNTGTAMLPESQVRILRLLARFSDELSTAWDVPREISLPGLSESLGLVRSAIHEPLKHLEENNLIETRQAHVIGGGTRKRTVIHITSSGRKQISNLVPLNDSSTTIDSIEGLYGRKSEIEQIESILSNGSVVLVGIPGIGKSAILQSISFETKYVIMNSTMDAKELVAKWLDISDPPNDLDVQVEMLSNCGYIVVDEVQEVHSRHRDGVFNLLHKLIDSNVTIAIGMRAPSPFKENITLQGIGFDAAQKLLGDAVDPEITRDVCEALAGHPLALHLWSPKDSLPEASNAVQQFVENTILANLSQDVRIDLDSLCIEPRPVPANYLREIDISTLDNAALLRWPNSEVEVQHLVRNVRRVAFEKPELIHREAVKRWAGIDDIEARWFEAYHRTMSGEDTTQFIIDNSEALMLSSSATASLLDDALHLLPDSNELRRMAASLALERGELSIASEYMEALPEPDYSLLVRLYRSQGKMDAADDAEKQAQKLLPKADVARMKLSRIVALIDDRLPDEVGDMSTVQKEISEIIIADFAASEKKSAIVLISILKHKIALLDKNRQIAISVRENLSQLSGHSDPIIERMFHIEEQHFAGNDSSKQFESEAAMRRLVGRTSDPIQRVSLGLNLVQAQARTNSLGALTTLESLQKIPLPLDKAAGRRLDAMIWFWKGQLNTEQRLTSWREAIFRFRRAECPNAASSLTTRMHREL